MRIHEIIKSKKPLTPQQAQINSLQQQKERVSTQLKTVKAAQKKQKAVADVQRANQALYTLGLS